MWFSRCKLKYKPQFYIYKPALQDLYRNPGSHLLSHAVPSIVPSAAQVLTIVFGMGTGVSPGRIATGNFSLTMIS